MALHCNEQKDTVTTECLAAPQITAKISELMITICDVDSCAEHTGCFKKSFTMVFQMLLCGKCYENIYT
jgi:hypothetical protein